MENQTNIKSGVYLSSFVATSAMVFILLLAFSAGFFAKSYFNSTSNSASSGLPTREAPQAPAKTPAQIYKLLPVVSQTDHIKGDSRADVVLVVYSDLQCPYCATFHNTVKQFLSKHSDVAFVYRHLPLDFHQFAVERAKGAECSASLGGADKFWTYLDAVFGSSDLNNVVLSNVASQIGLDSASFDTCLKSNQFDKAVSDSSSAGITFLTTTSDSGTYGTPGAVLINRKKQTAERLGGAVPLADIESAYNKIK